MILRSARVQLLLALSGTLLMGALAEAALRIAGVRYDATFHAADPQLGWALRPQVEGWFVSEGRQFVRINGEGMRSREHRVTKTADTLRIAVLGNSWTEALQVSIENNFCSVLERRLSGSACVGGRSVEVLNFGVSGYATAQQLLQLRTRVWKYQPDVVLLAFYTARDVLNNVRQFNSAADPAQSPYFVFAGDRLVIDDSFRALPQVQAASSWKTRARAEVAGGLRLFQALNRLVRLLRVAAAKATVPEVNGEPKGDLENVIYAPPPSPEVAGAWEVTEALLRTMNEEVTAHGASFLVVSLANRVQADPDPARRIELAGRLGVADLDYADQRLTSLGARAGFPVASLAHRLAGRAQRDHVYLNGFTNTVMGEGHWNEAGHQAAGEALADDVCVLLQKGGAAPRKSNTRSARR